MALVYIASVTASASATVSFTTGIDATYNEYQFHFVNIHPQTTDTTFQFQVNASNDTGGGFDTSLITSSAFEAFHRENNTGTPNIGYLTGSDLAQQALYQILTVGVSADGDSGASGILTLYDPSSTTYVKHFVARSQAMAEANDPGTSVENYMAGYINQTLAIPEISFKMSSGNIDSGTIHMYGVG